MTWRMRRGASALAAAGAAFGCLCVMGTAWGQQIKATQTDPKTVLVGAPGKFETTVTMANGFGETWYDLAHDPEKKRSLGRPQGGTGGLLWTKLYVGDDEKRGGGTNPPKTLELLEAGPVRARVRIAGVFNRRGMGVPAEDLNEIGFEQTFTMYPTGQVYVDYGLIAREADVKLYRIELILRPTGAWGKSGKGKGADEVHCAGEAGPAKPGGKAASGFALEWSDGPTYFQDILMVMYKGKYSGSYWNEGYEANDLRAGLDVLKYLPDRTLRKGTARLYVMMCFRDDINSPETAKLYAEAYRSPDKPAVTRGTADTTDAGDTDQDGFNEAEGCYVLKAAADGVEFVLHGKPVPRMGPAFKVKGWTGAVAKVTLAGKALAQGKDFNASVVDGTLLLQLLAPVKDDVQVTLGR